MVVVKDWEKYYTIEESSNILDKYIERSADDLIIELRRKRKKENKDFLYV